VQAADLLLGVIGVVEPVLAQQRGNLSVDNFGMPLAPSIRRVKAHLRRVAKEAVPDAKPGPRFF